MVPGVETKLSAKLSVGECSNLMWGVFSMVGDSIVDGTVWRGMCVLGNMRLPSIDVCSRLAHGDRTLWPSWWMSQD